MWAAGSGDGERGETRGDSLAFSPHFPHKSLQSHLPQWSDPMIIHHINTTSSPPLFQITQYFSQNKVTQTQQKLYRKIQEISRTPHTHLTMSVCHVLFQQTSAQDKWKLNDISCPRLFCVALVSRLMLGNLLSLLHQTDLQRWLTRLAMQRTAE